VGEVSSGWTPEERRLDSNLLFVLLLTNPD